MGKILVIVLLIILVLLSNIAYSKECTESLRPEINLNSDEDLFENVVFSRNVTGDDLSYLNYAEINSTLQTFSMNKETGEINFIPTVFDLGRHTLIFFAVNSLDCYSAKLVNLNIYDNPRIIPLWPESKYISMYEGQGIVFVIGVEDKDNDIKDYHWLINSIEQKGVFKERFVFQTNYNSTGEYNITVIVSDAKKLNDSYQWEVVVGEKNRDPYLFSEIPDFAVPTGEKVITNPLNNYFGDADNDTLRFTITATDTYGNDVDVETSIDMENKLTIDAKNFTGIVIIEITAKDLLGGLVKGNKFEVYVFNMQDSSKFDENTIHECGDGICSGNETCRLCERDCGPCLLGETRCVNDWECKEWSLCMPMGYMTRECTDKRRCYDQTAKPKEISKCELKDSCFDKIRNNGEKKVDCGGPCQPCPTCDDKLQNQGEAGIDCGGPCDAQCPTCDDKMQNQFESDIDCGGPCDECEDDLKCYSWKDCKSHICKNTVCQKSTCNDGVKNQDENGVDCEGVCQNLCPTCFDEIKNQNETGVDCGGQCPICPTCNDKIKNQDEKYIDCGGKCRKCLWSDYKRYNPGKALTIQIMVLVFFLPFAILIVFEIYKKIIGKSKIERLILLNSILRMEKRKRIFKDKKEAIENTSIKIKTMLKENAATNKKNLKEDITAVLCEFLENMAKIDISNDEGIMYQRIKTQNFGYTISKIIFYIATETKEISSNKYLSGFEVASRLEKISMAITEIEKET